MDRLIIRGNQPPHPCTPTYWRRRTPDDVGAIVLTDENGEWVPDAPLYIGAAGPTEGIPATRNKTMEG